MRALLLYCFIALYDRCYAIDKPNKDIRAMLKKKPINHVFLLTELTEVSSAGFAQAQLEPGEQATSLSSSA